METISMESELLQINSLQSATEEINTSFRKLDSTWYKIAMILTKVKDEELYKEEGFKTFDQYITERIEYKKSTIYNLLNVAKHFILTEQETRNVGISKLTLLCKLGTDEAINSFLTKVDIYNTTFRELKLKIDEETSLDENSYFRNYSEDIRESFLDVNKTITSHKAIFNKIKYAEHIDESAKEKFNENTNELVEQLRQLQDKINNL